MNSNSTSPRIYFSNSTPALGFDGSEIKAGCGNDNNVLIIMAEPYMRPFSTRYMCEILCQSQSISYMNPGYTKKTCYIENCNQNSTVYLFSKPFVGSSGCFFPFGSAGQPNTYSTSWFWKVTLLLSAICFTGFVLNVSVIVVSLKRTATCDMRKIIAAVCVYEALASVVFFLDHFLYWLNEGGPDTFMSNYVLKYVIDPNFVRTFGSFLLLVISCHLAVFRPEALDFMLQSKLKTVIFCLLFAVHIFFLYFMLVYPLTRYIENAIPAQSILIMGIVQRVMDSNVISLIILGISNLFGLIMNLIAHYGLYQRKKLAKDASVLEKLKENRSVAYCVLAIMVVEQIVLIPVYCTLWYMIKPLLSKPAAATATPTVTPPSVVKGSNVTLPPLSPAMLAQLGLQQPPPPPTTTMAPSPVDLWVQSQLIPLGFFFEAALPILIALILIFIYRPSRQLVAGSKKVNANITIVSSPLNEVVT